MSPSDERMDILTRFPQIEVLEELVPGSLLEVFGFPYDQCSVCGLRYEVEVSRDKRLQVVRSLP